MNEGSKVHTLSGRYRLTEDEELIILKYREQKTLLDKECEVAGIDPKDVRHYWYKSKMFSVFAKGKTKNLEDLKKEIMDGMKTHSPKYREIKRKKLTDSHCLVIDPADIHIGKLGSAFETGDKYNVNIAIKRVRDGITGLINQSSCYKIDQIVLFLGNDILHTDTSKRTTTAGTPQDTDGMWYDNFLVAQKLYVEIIEMLLPIANVHLIHDVSNHDYMSGWMLTQSVQSWFSKSKNITFDTSMKHRKAYKYHNNLIGSTHGDGAKESDLPILFAQEFKKMWYETEHRYIFGKHRHHKTSKDYVGVTYETSRSASGTDGWHHRNGYQHSVKAVEAYIHHKQLGQVARLTHKFI